jgi:hypothetical protein
MNSGTSPEQLLRCRDPDALVGASYQKCIGCFIWQWLKLFAGSLETLLSEFAKPFE